MNKLVIVGGTFDEVSGKSSSLVTKLFESIKKYNKNYELHLINGGNIQQLKNFLYCTTYISTELETTSILIWMPNLSNEYSVKFIQDIKQRKQNLLLVSSKRCIEKDYTNLELITRALKTHSNLLIKVNSSNDHLYSLELHSNSVNFSVNLKGHGFLILSDNLDYLESMKSKIIARPCLEYQAI